MARPGDKPKNFKVENIKLERHEYIPEDNKIRDNLVQFLQKSGYDTIVKDAVVYIISDEQHKDNSFIALENAIEQYSYKGSYGVTTNKNINRVESCALS